MVMDLQGFLTSLLNVVCEMAPYLLLGFLIAGVLHVFPNKDKAYSEILRTLKSGGELLACFYIAGEQRVADWLAKTVMTHMGWFTPPFDTANDVRKRLGPYYEILDFHVEGAMLYFRARKR